MMSARFVVFAFRRAFAGRRTFRSGSCKELAMSYKITDECAACGSCMGTCPSEAIKEGQEKYSIDPDECIDCGTCVEHCPVGAIVEG